MPWYGKEQPTPFDASPVAGLKFLHGDVMARQYKQEWLAGQKYPLITFSSGIEREFLIPRNTEGQKEAVHLSGGLTLPYQSSRDAAYEQLVAQDADQEYRVVPQGETELHVVNLASGRSYRVFYDQAAGQLADIQRFPEAAMELLPGEARAALPKLYSQEKKGMEVVAPVKFFTPDSSWTWYPTEYDGADIFFGLVSGFEVELGYFSLSELEGVRGRLGLPVERDLYYSPKTLRDLKAEHERP